MLDRHTMSTPTINKTKSYPTVSLFKYLPYKQRLRAAPMSSLLGDVLPPLTGRAFLSPLTRRAVNLATG